MFFDVEFGDGAIGFILKCSLDGEVTVVGLAYGGQAELYNVKVGDCVIAVDGVEVDSIEKIARCLCKRPVRICFVRKDCEEIEKEKEVAQYINIDDYETESDGTCSVDIDPRNELSDFSDH